LRPALDLDKARLFTTHLNVVTTLRDYDGRRSPTSPYFHRQPIGYGIRVMKARPALNAALAGLDVGFGFQRGFGPFVFLAMFLLGAFFSPFCRSIQSRLCVNDIVDHLFKGRSFSEDHVQHGPAALNMVTKSFLMVIWFGAAKLNPNPSRTTSSHARRLKSAPIVGMPTESAYMELL